MKKPLLVKKVLCVVIAVLMLAASVSVFAQNDKDNGHNKSWKSYSDQYKYLKELLKKYHALDEQQLNLFNQIIQLKKKHKVKNCSVFVNGSEISLEAAPVIKAGRMLIPVNAVTKALGAKLTQDSKNNTITIVKNDITIVIKPWSRTVTVNGTQVDLDSYTNFNNKRMFVPISLISKILKCKVLVDPATGTIIIDDRKVSSINDNVTGAGPMQFNYFNTADWSYTQQQGAFKNDVHKSSTQGAYSEFKFTGIQIKLYGAKGPDQGKAAVSIDGGPEVVIDLYNASRTDDVLLYASSFLPKKEHVLKVKVTGDKNASSSGAAVTIDRVDVVKDFNSQGAIKGSTQTAPGSVVLSTGTADWAHWGYADASSFNRKASVTPTVTPSASPSPSPSVTPSASPAASPTTTASAVQQISNFSIIGSGAASWQPSAPVLFSWTGGAPVASATDNTSAIYLTGESNGLQITVPASTTEKTLKIYLGAWYSKVGVEAFLSDSSAAVYKCSVDSPSGLSCKVLTLKYKSSLDLQTLTVKLTISKAYNPTFGRIILQAATLN